MNDFINAFSNILLTLYINKCAKCYCSITKKNVDKGINFFYSVDLICTKWYVMQVVDMCVQIFPLDNSI